MTATQEARPAVDLSRFDEDYRRAPASEQQQSRPAQAQMRFGLPDGQYRVTVESVELTTAKSSGNPLLKWRFRVTAGAFENRLLFKNRAITPNTIEWVKKEMKACGLELEPFSDLPHRLRDLLNVQLAIAKVTKGDNENIYINKRLTPKCEGDLAELSDDLPF